MEKTNMYFTTDASKYSDQQVKDLKENNIFIIHTLSYLINLDGDSNKLHSDYKNAIMKRELPSTANINNCHAKLRFLIIALKNQENREKFLKSGIVKYVMNPLLKGYTQNEADGWDNYVNKQESTDIDVTKKSPYRAGLYCYRHSDRNFPIGLDFTKVIDTIVKVDENGRYYISDETDEKTKSELLGATQSQIDSIKGSQRFKNSFYNYDPEATNEDEREDD